MGKDERNTDQYTGRCFQAEAGGRRVQAELEWPRCRPITAASSVVSTDDTSYERQATKTVAAWRDF